MHNFSEIVTEIIATILGRIMQGFFIAVGVLLAMEMWHVI